MAQRVKASARNAQDLGSILGREDPLEKGTATHSSILAWVIPQTEEPGQLLSMGVTKSQKVIKQLKLLLFHRCIHSDWVLTLYQVASSHSLFAHPGLRSRPSAWPVSISCLPLHSA